jgi:hypothetical protein
VRFELWYPRYRWIADRFGYEESADQIAAVELDGYLDGRAVDLRSLRRLVGGENVLVFGSGPSLMSRLEGLTDTSLLEELVCVAADDATKAFYDLHVKVPEIVVTDLDGEQGYLLNADRDGSLMVVHAHGDNRDALRRLVPMMRNVLGTTQVRPVGSVRNFGGFTDGDRAVFMAADLGAKSITLAGMELGEEFGEYSKVSPGERIEKLRKLRTARELLGWLSDTIDIPLCDVSWGDELKGFRRVTLDDLSLYLSGGEDLSREEAPRSVC